MLAEIYAQALKAKGLDVQTKLNIGSREAIFPALEQGDLNVLPEYSGALLSYLTKAKSDAKEINAQVTDIKANLPRQADRAEPSAGGGQGHDHLQQGDRRQVRPHVDRGPREGRRPDHVSAARPSSPSARASASRRSSASTAAEFKKFQPLDVAGPLTVAALKDNKVQCANLFSTQSAIPANGFVTLEDPKLLARGRRRCTPLIDKDVGDAGRHRDRSTPSARS